MSGVTPLVDTLLATRLAQRPDLVPLKSQAAIAGPGAPTRVEKVVNDVRLPSRAALEQQLGVGLAHGDAGKHNAPRSGHLGETVTLSAAARTVSAILEPSAGSAPKIQGHQPLWPHPPPPVAQQMTTALARTVAISGLFYESHLQQYVAGTRTFSQLAQEPQAHLDAAGKGLGEMPGTVTQDPVQDRAPGNVLRAGPSAMPVQEGIPADDMTGRNPAPLSRARHGAAAGDLAVGSSAPIFMDEAGAEKLPAETSDTRAADAPRSNTPASAGLGVHPDLVALVRQQLELLAVPVFRWSGEAWAGTPVEWEIREEREETAGEQAPQGSWSTRLSLSLPALGVVEVFLRLAGTSLRVDLAAQEDATVALLRGSSGELPGRLGGFGLELTGMQIGPVTGEPAAQAGREDADGA
ncbi:flagellar hook-length control protein FliK [Polaromonas sp.]|uniref:flagellar hook-length control protein FliK n=1 Tax=Polaromonas sp. TaxID=1869339 RepID=UPI003C928B63